MTTDIENFKISDVVPPVVHQKQFEQGGGRSITYYEFPIRYNHVEENGKRTISTMLIQTGKFTLKYGISKQVVASGPDGSKEKTSAALKLSGDENGEVLEKLLVDMRDYVVKCIMSVDPLKLGAFGKMIRGQSEETVKALLRPPYHVNTDTNTKIKYLELNEYGGVTKTGFFAVTADSGNTRPINIALLIGRPIDIIPTLWCKRVYMGAANSSLQWFLDSAIVTRFYENMPRPGLLRAAKRAYQMDPEGIESVLSMIKSHETGSHPPDVPSPFAAAAAAVESAAPNVAAGAEEDGTAPIFQDTAVAAARKKRRVEVVDEGGDGSVGPAAERTEDNDDKLPSPVATRLVRSFPPARV
jgi:hypothetical protein